MSEKEMKFKNVSRKGKTFDGYKEEDAKFFSYEKLEQFASETGRSIADAYKYLKKFFGSNDMRRGGMVVNTVDNRKRK